MRIIVGEQSKGKHKGVLLGWGCCWRKYMPTLTRLIILDGQNMCPVQYMPYFCLFLIAWTFSPVKAASAYKEEEFKPLNSKNQSIHIIEHDAVMDCEDWHVLSEKSSSDVRLLCACLCLASLTYIFIICLCLSSHGALHSQRAACCKTLVERPWRSNLPLTSWKSWLK